MLGKAIEKLAKVRSNSLGPLVDLLNKMVDDPDTWDRILKPTLKGKNPYPDKPGIVVKVATPGLFEEIRKVKLPELTEFKPAEKIVATPERDRATAPIPIGYVDPDLTALMNRIGVEPTKGKLVLTVRKILQQATFGEMLPALPRQAKRVSIGRVFQMVEKQGRGEEGDLLVNGWANFFLLEEDPDVVLYCYFAPGRQYWSFDLYPSSRSYQWRVGHQFFS